MSHTLCVHACVCMHLFGVYTVCKWVSMYFMMHVLVKSSVHVCIYRLKFFFPMCAVNWIPDPLFFQWPFFSYVGDLHSISLRYFLRILKKQNIFLLYFHLFFSFLPLSFLISPPTLISRKPIVRCLIKLTHTHTS